MINHMNEYIVLINEQGEAIGVAPKLSSHHANTPLHSGFSCYVFNEAGDFLLTQRALHKKVWPSVWTNSVCGHRAPGEAVPVAIQRRLAYELGISVASEIELINSTYRYTTPAYNGIVEYKFCPLYIARTTQAPLLNLDEVAAYRWQSWERTSRQIADSAEAFSHWFLEQFQIVNAHPLLPRYTKANYGN